MESARTFLWLTFGALIMFLFIEWNNQGPALQIENQQKAASTTTEIQNYADESSASFQQNLPSINASETVTDTAPANKASETTTISNDLLAITVDSKGADIIGAKLLTYYPNKNEKDSNIELMYINNPLFEFHRLQSGLLSASGNPSPTHLENYTLESRGRDSLSYVWLSGYGIKVTKTIKLSPDSYLVDVMFSIENMAEDSGAFVP